MRFGGHVRQAAAARSEVSPEGNISQAEMPQDLLDNEGVVEERHDSHPAVTSGANQRVNLPDCCQQSGPTLSYASRRATLFRTAMHGRLLLLFLAQPSRLV